MTQVCSEGGCDQPAAFKTRTKPAWCNEHITEILRRGSLEPLEPFEAPKQWRLTRCLQCGVEAHYHLDYTVDKNRYGEATCRACHWTAWAAKVSRGTGVTDPRVSDSVDATESVSGGHGIELLDVLPSPPFAANVSRVRCRLCERISVQPGGASLWSCQCRSNPKRSAQTSNVSGPKRLNLFKDSADDAMAWWDHDRNSQKDWDTATVTARREVFWLCSDCGASIRRRVCDVDGAPICEDCAARDHQQWEAEYARYKTMLVSEVPALLSAWADDADPSTVTVAGTFGLRKFRCPNGHSPRVNPLRYLESGCPTCRGNTTKAARLAAAEPGQNPYSMSPEIAAQWHPSRNGTINPATVSARSRKTAWWLDAGCGHEWQATPLSRDKGERLRCPTCRTVLDSLAFHYPDTAAEWSPNNPLTAWQVRPTAQTRFTPEWVCSKNSAHIWEMPLASRSGGGECPDCQEWGKSKVELAHATAAATVFAAVRSGQSVPVAPPRRRSPWRVDIAAELAGGRKIAIEYDGAYWHADKVDKDTEKTLDLLAAGYLVARLREDPLPSLGITDDRYAEFTVYATHPQPDRVIRSVQEWASAVGSL